MSTREVVDSTYTSNCCSYLMSMPSEDAIEEYIDNLFKAVDGGKQHRSFLREYLVRWKSLREKEDLLVPLKRLKDDQLVLFETKKSKNKKVCQKVDYCKIKSLEHCLLC